MLCRTSLAVVALSKANTIPARTSAASANILIRYQTDKVPEWWCIIYSFLLGLIMVQFHILEHSYEDVISCLK